MNLNGLQLEAAGVGSYFRPRDVAPLGVSFRDVQRLVSTGEAEKLYKGLYRLNAIEATELETIAMVCSAIPSAIVCLMTALSIYEIGTQSPPFVWVGLDRKARKPARPPAMVRFVRFSGPMLHYGVETRTVQGVRVRITSPARTVVDCFRYRNKIGIDVAMEALQSAFRTHSATMGQIIRAAEVCRVITVIKPYLQALSV
jgi:predicted transcriptional regulator of viral defense system